MAAWTFADLIGEKRSYLLAAVPFDEIVARIKEELRTPHFEIESATGEHRLKLALVVDRSSAFR